MGGGHQEGHGERRQNRQSGTIRLSEDHSAYQSGKENMFLLECFKVVQKIFLHVNLVENIFGNFFCWNALRSF